MSTRETHARGHARFRAAAAACLVAAAAVISMNSPSAGSIPPEPKWLDYARKESGFFTVHINSTEMTPTDGQIVASYSYSGADARGPEGQDPDTGTVYICDGVSTDPKSVCTEDAEAGPLAYRNLHPSDPPKKFFARFRLGTLQLDTDSIAY